MTPIVNVDRRSQSIVVNFPNILPGNNTTIDTDTSYDLLADLPGLEGVYQTAGDCPLGKYLKIMFGLFLGTAAVLAMVMIVMGGMEYMTSELISSKESGKDKIKNAIFGLLLALSAYLILNTINPNLLDICLDGIPKAQIVVGPAPESSAPFVAASNTALASLGINCPGSGGAAALPSIAQSFVGKVTYSQTNRNTTSSSPPTLFLDCSSFVKQVYACADLVFQETVRQTCFLELRQ